MTERRRFLVPEVIQTSAMDCGPATLKCVLEGFGIPASYGRLREACQTDVDGTSIDTLEDIAVSLGLDAEQALVPGDHLALASAQVLPALVVLQRPDLATHFVVAWRVHGDRVQVMDPAIGRRWMRVADLVDQLYRHAMVLPASDWLAWARSPEFVAPLSDRMARLGIAAADRTSIIDAAAIGEDGEALAALDAAVRLCGSLRQAGALRPGREAAALLDELCRRARTDPEAIPDRYWSVRPDEPDEDGDPQRLVRGAVLIRFKGVAAGAADDRPATLRQVLDEPPPRPLRALLDLLVADGPGVLLTTVLASAAVTAGLLVEALLLRGLLDVGGQLRLVEQRAAATGSLLVFALALLLVEMPIAAGLMRLGRRLELRLRAALLRKTPRLGDRWFHSRPTSDMAERGHSLHTLRQMPELAEGVLRPALGLVLMAAAIVWLDPRSALPAMLAATTALVVPWLAQAALCEQDMQVRTHEGALGRFYLDTLIGLTALRTHSAQRVVAHEHESLLTHWARAGYGLQARVVLVEGAQLLAGFGLAAWLLFAHFARDRDAGTLLLLVYWALSLPVMGQELSAIARRVPPLRNRLLRLLEPLTAPEEPAPESGDVAGAVPVAQACGVHIRCEAMTLRAAGQTVLRDVDLDVAAGEHVAVVGPSGAGKSSLVGALLGWLTPCEGRLLVDGHDLDAGRLARLRGETAWVDPEVRLWNRSLLDNLAYGSADGSALPFARMLDATSLQDLLQHLPDGLQSELGEAGGLLSGGEGQCVRLGRAMLRTGVRLVILDEPFRGLERARRAALLAECRRLWSGATLFFASHDIADALHFDRVLVVDGGRIVEQGAPSELAARPDSRLRALLDVEREVRERIWSSPRWTRWQIKGGRLVDPVR